MSGTDLRIDDGVSRGTRVSFSFDGRQVEAFADETVAAALWASGIRSWSADETYGPPTRALFCAMGVCQQCAVWIDGVRVEACRTPVRDKLDVSTRP